jgi:hypothetical protein
MTKFTLWDPTIGERPANLALTNNFAGTTNPGVGNDSTQGYTPGSVWVNVTGQTVWTCISNVAGAANWIQDAQNTAIIAAPAGTAASITGGVASTTTGAGGASNVVGGAGGSTSGTGGAAQLTGGAGTAGNANGGDVNLAGGAPNGSGVKGVVRVGGIELITQDAQNAQTVSATLTAANVLTGIITVAQGSAGASALQLPLATAMDTALPTSAANDAFDFSLINISTVAAESASITTNTGWILVGDMDVAANNAATTKSAGRFRARKTGTGAWTLYRLS